MSALVRGCAVLVGVAALATAGCKQSAQQGTPDSAATAPSAAEPLPPGVSAGPVVPTVIRRPATVPGAPIPVASASAALNPRGLPPYSGPVGSVEGVVRMTGQPPKTVDLRVPPTCTAAVGTYGTNFREGPGRTVADVMVAVTGYDGFVPAKAEAVQIDIEGCAYDRRTVVMTYGQHLEVFNRDARASYVPFLVGDTAPAHMVAIPKGPAIKLYPTRVGHYLLKDEMLRDWMAADVIVVKYPTHDVTSLDGKFRIDGIPVGKVTVTAYLPAIDAQFEKQLTIEPGKTVRADMVLTHAPKKPEPAAAPTTSGPVIK